MNMSFSYFTWNPASIATDWDSMLAVDPVANAHLPNAGSIKLQSWVYTTLVPGAIPAIAAGLHGLTLVAISALLQMLELDAQSQMTWHGLNPGVVAL
jgi:hypothetical protein